MKKRRKGLQAWRVEAHSQLDSHLLSYQFVLLMQSRQTVAAELENADCNPPREQLQRPALANLPSNQLLDAPTIGIALSLTGACLLTMTT